MRTQRGFAIMLIVYALAFLAAIGATWAVVHKINNWCNTACREARQERDTLAAEKRAALAREAAIANMWADQVMKSDAAATQRKQQNESTFNALLDRARTLPHGIRGAAGVVLSGDSGRLLADATRAANAAQPAAQREARADTVPDATATDAVAVYDQTELIGFMVSGAKAYADAVNQWAACVSFYEGLQRAEVAEQLH